MSELEGKSGQVPDVNVPGVDDLPHAQPIVDPENTGVKVVDGQWHLGNRYIYILIIKYNYSRSILFLCMLLTRIRKLRAQYAIINVRTIDDNIMT